MSTLELRSPNLVSSRPNHPARPIDIAPQYGDDHLSSCERELLLQVIEGQSNKVIAWHLGLELSTVKVHLDSLLPSFQF
jgi:DNA-binding NarL/FixJ family response regulator